MRMIYEKMVQTENSDCMRETWRVYRQWMTEYVRSGMEQFYHRRHLAENKKLRDADFTLEQYLETERKPVVAIWGAGRCNDLELATLSRYADLVLIDRETDWIMQARERAGLTEAQCRCVNLDFWEIYEEEEQHFEKLLIEADDSHMAAYLQQVTQSVASSETEIKEGVDLFDFSVVCGLASQLNGRFTGLFQAYGLEAQKYPRTVSALKEMYVQGAAALFEAVQTTTRSVVFTANELYAVPAAKDGAVQADMEQYDAEWEELLATQGAGIPEENRKTENLCHVTGSGEFLQRIEQAWREKSLSIEHRCGRIWPFSDEKHYFMDVLTAYFINKEVK